MTSNVFLKKSLFFVTFFSFSAQAQNLVQVYNDAITHDPTFQQATATWHAQQENLPIARSHYLPQVDINALTQYQYASTVQFPLPGIPSNITNSVYQYQIAATQPIFNAPNWFAIRGAHAVVKAATATYSLSAQNLMLRTAQKYFEVLQAYDQLLTTRASKRAYYEDYVNARQKYEVGLIARTGVYQAQSYYDIARAQEISDQNFLFDKIEELRAITGRHYRNLNGIASQVPLIIPAPNDINTWVQVAQSQNYGLIADQFTMLSARENIRQQETGNYPQLNAQASWQQSKVRGTPGFGILTITTGEQAYAGLSMNFPLVQGGYVVASTHQAIYQYEQSSAQLEIDDRSVVTNTRQSFLGIISGIGQVKADKLAIISAQKALEATRAGYSVGTQTMQDVLTDTSNLYKAKQRYFDDQYIYLSNIFGLKYAAGTLSPRDIVQINAWLKQNISFNLPGKLFKRDSQISVPRLQAEKANIPIVNEAEIKNVPEVNDQVPPKNGAELTPPEATHKNGPYVLQLYSSSSVTGARQFIQQYPAFKSDMRILQHGHYYRVVYGRYPNYQAAQFAGKELKKKGLTYFLISKK